MKQRNAPQYTRRSWLQTVAAGSVGFAAFSKLPPLQAAEADWQKPLLTYLASHARTDGGYAWADQEESHLTPTFAVIGGYRLLGQMPPKPQALAEFVRTHHPLRLMKPEQDLLGFIYQQIQCLAWLGDDAKDFQERVQKLVKPARYMARYEKHSYPIFEFELTAFIGRDLLKLPFTDISQEFTNYLNERRRSNGSFNNTPAADGTDGNILNTWWGLRVLHLLKREQEQKKETAAWLRACQLANGGFTHQPKPSMGAMDDVAYTWAAVRALELLESVPTKREECIQYILSLQNSDGGFGDRPGWLSNPVATYYALDALQALGALNAKTFSGNQTKPAKPIIDLPDELQIFSAQIEAHGQGSPSEAVDLARSLRIHLWGAKNPAPGWLAAAQKVADSQKVPVTFFRSDEEYGTFVDFPGFGTYSHTSDIIAPAKAEIGEPIAKAGDVSWETFRERRLKPLEKGMGRLIWQFGENEALVRTILDDSILRGGFAAISTFHFGNPDFTNSEPFLQRYRGQIPFIGLQDAHGPEPWWFADVTTGFRTLFLAKAPTWDGWLTALKNNWTVAVRKDERSGGKLWVHGGSDAVVNFVRQRELLWRWWDNPAIQRPLVSIVAVKPGDEFEAGRPQSGVNLRVRCQWTNTNHGVLKKELVRFKQLQVDGKYVQATSVTTGKPNKLTESYHECRLTDLKPGRHIANVSVEILATKQTTSRTLEFTI